MGHESARPPAGRPAGQRIRSELHCRLRDAAAGYVRAGWPILPVETPTGDRLICGRCPRDVATVHDWWAEEPYGIAGCAGDVFDVVEMPTWLGALVLPSLRQHGNPAVVEVPLTGSWLFLVTPGSPRITDLPAGCGVTLHGEGRWILLPPTPVVGGSVAWVGQDGRRGRLPHSMTVQWAALKAFVAARRPQLPPVS
jgi:hypothetical protein